MILSDSANVTYITYWHLSKPSYRKEGVAALLATQNGQ